MKLGKLVLVGLVVGLLMVTLRESLAEEPPFETESFPDKPLEQFVIAFITVRDLNAVYRQEIAQSDGMAEATELRDEARALMTEAIERSGLEVGEYNFIAHQLRKNPQLFMPLSEMLAP